MNNSDLEKYWWSKITSAKSFVNATVDALREHKIPVLLVPNDLPWRETMRVVIQESITKDISTLSIETIDVHDEGGDSVEPGSFLLEYLKDVNYRKGGRFTIQEHILRNGLLENKLLWIKGLSRNNYEDWVNFCDGFIIHQRNQGMIVIEVPFEENLSDYGNLKAVQYETLIRDYGVQLFLDHILDQMEYSDNWKRYLSMLISSLCKKDVEVACDFAQKFNHKVTRIDDALKQLAKDLKYERRGSAEGHILNLVRNSKQDDINRLVWIAQMQVLFPILEVERVKWVKYYEKQIKNVLEKQTVLYADGITRILDPYEIEVKHLYTFYYNKDLDENFDAKKLNRLEVMRECRNHLAHLKTCKHEWVYALLEFKGLL